MEKKLLRQPAPKSDFLSFVVRGHPLAGAPEILTGKMFNRTTSTKFVAPRAPSSQRNPEIPLSSPF
ncbi:MAG: hypothetical protein ACREP8_14080, partial [Candidatus Binatia bacterium]